jgi:hypothetical protein
LVAARKPGAFHNAAVGEAHEAWLQVGEGLHHVGPQAAKSMLSNSLAGNCEEMRCVCTVTAESYAINAGYTWELHQGISKKTPSARANRIHRVPGLEALEFDA